MTASSPVPTATRVGTTAVLVAGVLAVAPPAQASPAVPAEGEFTVSIAAPPVATAVGANCLLTVEGTLTFTGTLDGSAGGTTQALVLAPCSAVTTNPPGTFRDVFWFSGDFEGSAAGVPVSGELVYAGVTAPGGEIDAGVRLSGDAARAALRADAEILVGGTYSGVVVL